MGTDPNWLPSDIPIADPKVGNRIPPPWLLFFQKLLTQAANAITTAVTSVTASAPITSSGGATPNIALSDSGVTAGSYTNADVTVNAKGLVTAIANGGGGGGTVTHTAGALTANELVVGNGGADIKTVAATDGQIPIGKSSDGSVTLATITAGANVTVTNSPAGITIAATGGGTGGWGLVLLESHTASASSELDFTGWYSSSYDEYQIEVINLVLSSADRPQIQLSTNGGSSYDNGANYNAQAFETVFAGSSTSTGNSSVGGFQFRPGADVTLAANGSWNASLRLMNPGGSLYKILMGQIVWEASGSWATSQWVGTYHPTTPVNAFRLLTVGGATLASGTVRVYGLVK